MMKLIPPIFPKDEPNIYFLTMRYNLKCGVGKGMDFVRAVVSLGMVYYQQDYHIINLIQFKITSRPNNKEILQILKLLLKVLSSE